MKTERGSVLLLVMLILVALFAGGAIALSLQLGNTRGSGLARSSRSTTYCAEAGLQQARQMIMANSLRWNTVLANGADGTWYPEGGIVGDSGDGDTGTSGTEDWRVTIVDNDDEFPTPDATRDNDLQILVRSMCLMDPNQPRSIVEMLRANLTPTQYQSKCKGGQCTNDMTP